MCMECVHGAMAVAVGAVATVPVIVVYKDKVVKKVKEICGLCKHDEDVKCECLCHEEKDG